MSDGRVLVPSGIGPLDERVGGLEAGGSFLVVGAPGPDKMVAALQFVHAGVRAGERCALVTNADAEGILSVAAAWGFDMESAWRSGHLRIVGFREDFELRALRSSAPEEVLEELDEIIGPDVARVAVDPGSLFLAGGARSLLGSTFLAWARGHGATVVSTFSVDGGASGLPSSADWLLHATTGRLLLEKRGDGLYQITVARALPSAGEREETISLALESGGGLVEPSEYPARRSGDRAGIDEGRLLLLSLGGEHSSDLETWVARSFETDIVTEPLDAVAAIRSSTRYGVILIHTRRRRGREALQACRAIRPLTRGVVVVASDDPMRAMDRIYMLEAGADDFLSGGIDFRELGLRIRRSTLREMRPTTEASAGPASDVTPPPVAPMDGGRVPLDVFVDELRRRAATPDLAFFCVLEVASTSLARDELEVAVAEQVRAEDGDIVTTIRTGCAVLLQGAREGQLGGFLDRLRSRLDQSPEAGGDAGLTIDVLSHPTDAERIMALLAEPTWT